MPVPVRNARPADPDGMNLVSDLVEELLFPALCACCGCRLASGELRLCEGCRRWGLERFDPADHPGLPDLLPAHVAFRAALWQFDAAGKLRGLLHRLKYRRDYRLGVELGLELGRLVRERFDRSGLCGRYEPLLVPVPLHRSRFRVRGYNQAAAICEGVSRLTGWTHLDSSKVVRSRKTGTQTGLDAQERARNLEGAFDARDLELLSQELPVIVDDVYTTGATVLELAATLKRAGAQKTAIAVLAVT